MNGIALSDLLQVFQAIAVAFGIIAFYIEYRKSRKDKGYETYVQTILATVDIEKLFIEHPEMQKLWAYNDEYMRLGKEKRKMYHWCSMLIDIFEIVFIASPLHRSWMGKDEWDGWEQYIDELIENSEVFRITWESNKELYCRKFRTYIDGRFRCYMDKHEREQSPQIS